MQLPPRTDRLDTCPERRAQLLRAVAGGRQTRATVGAVGRERPDHDRGAGLERSVEDFPVSRLIRGVGEEVEHRPVMPDLVPLHRSPRQQIRDHPLNLLGALTETPPGLGKTDVGHVEHRHIRVPPAQQCIHQPRCTGTNVDDGIGQRYAKTIEQLQRERRLGLEPTDRVLRRPAVHRVPMTSTFAVLATAQIIGAHSAVRHLALTAPAFRPLGYNAKHLALATGRGTSRASPPVRLWVPRPSAAHRPRRGAGRKGAFGVADAMGASATLAPTPRRATRPIRGTGRV